MRISDLLFNAIMLALVFVIFGFLYLAYCNPEMLNDVVCTLSAGSNNSQACRT